MSSLGYKSFKDICRPWDICHHGICIVLRYMSSGDIFLLRYMSSLGYMSSWDMQCSLGIYVVLGY